MSETIHQPSSQDKHSQRNVYAELKTGMQQAETNIELEKQKTEAESQVIDKLLKKYPKENQQIYKIDDMEVVACGEEVKAEQVQVILKGLQKVRDKLDGDYSKIFNGLKIFIAADIIPGGGQAFGRENVVIMDTNKMAFSVCEMEDMLSPSGEYRAGDQSNLIGREAKTAELGLVHELGHILEFKAHGDYDKSFIELDQSEAPTLYGQQNPREDYAESWMYYIYGGNLDSQRTNLLKTDTENVLTNSPNP